MSPWPGTPKSQQSPPINAPSTREAPKLNEHSTMGDVADAVRTAFNGLTVHEQAFAVLPNQIKTQAAAAATAAVEQITSQTTEGVTSFNSATGAIIYFPSLGLVNDQLGSPSYLTQQSDAGVKIIVGDSTPVAIVLNPALIPPWFTIIGNDSSATAVISAGSGVGFNGVASIYPGGFVLIFYDGSTFWSEGVQIATNSQLGVVKPDGSTITVDSTGTLHVPGGGGGNHFLYNFQPSGGPTSWTLPHTPELDAAGKPCLGLYAGAARIWPGIANDWVWDSSVGITTNYAVANLWGDMQY